MSADSLRAPGISNNLEVPNIATFNNPFRRLFTLCSYSEQTNKIIHIQSTPLNRATSVRGHFGSIKRRTLLTENILY